MIYSTTYRHKIATLRTDAGPDIILEGQETSCPKLLARALREQGILERGERLWEYRIDPTDGRILVFPGRRSPWHCVEIAPKGAWVAVDLR